MIIAFCWLCASEFISLPGLSVISITGVYNAYGGCIHGPQNKTPFTMNLFVLCWISLFLVSLCQGWGAARNFFTASSDSIFHPPLSLVFFFQSSSSPAFLTSLLTQSSHLSLGLPRLLLPCSRNSAALFGSLSSAILSTCPAHCNLLLTSLSIKLLCTPVSYLNSTILRLSALVTLAILRTQLFSHTCSLCCCSSVSAKVSVCVGCLLLFAINLWSKLPHRANSHSHQLSRVSM